MEEQQMITLYALGIARRTGVEDEYKGSQSFTALTID